MIHVEGLRKFYLTHRGEAHAAVDGLTFQVPRGTVYGLLGPNGAGKSTTLRVLAGLMTPTSGHVSIDGVHGVLELKTRVGFLTADTGLYARLTARETLVYFAELRGMDGAAARAHADGLLKLLNIEALAERRCEGLSTGERQRVQIARTLVGDPPVLILDEPTRGLDVLTNRVIHNFIREAGAAGRTIVLSTHHLDEVDQLCQRFGLLHKGRLLIEGTLDELRAATGCQKLSDVFLKLVEQEEGAAGGLARGVAAPRSDAPQATAGGGGPAHAAP